MVMAVHSVPQSGTTPVPARGGKTPVPRQGTKRSITMDIKELKFDEKGLIPAIVQDHYTKEVLTLAYMNAESLAITIDERRTCFWSRSRQIGRAHV